MFDNRVLNTNSKGLRGQVEYIYKKPEGMQRILALGDSFTFGEEVGDSETYPYHLQTMAPEAQVINMACTVTVMTKC